MYRTIKEAIIDIFFKEILEIKKPLKIKKNTKLTDFCQNKNFEKEFLEMMINRVERTFKVNIRKVKNESLEEIFNFIEYQKKIKK